MALEPFESSRLLIQRGRRHVEEFRGKVETYLTGPWFRKIIEPQIRSGEYLFKIRFARLPPHELSVVAFDAINCLRSALDHAVFDAAVRVGGRPNPNHTKFPHGLTKEEAEKDFLRNHSEVPELLRSYILSFEPFKGGKNNLWEVNRLRNSKIHKMLVPAAATHRGLDISGFVNIAAKILREWNDNTNVLTCARINSASPTTKFNVDVTVNFSGEYFPIIYDASEILTSYGSIVESVVSGLEVEADRLTA